MKIKVKDIAEAAGVSPSTVSLVLNNKPSRIAEDTKEHIFRVAREMQFQRESEANFYEFKKVKTLGLMVPDSRNYFFNQLAEEIAEYAYAREYVVFQCHTGDGIDRFYAAMECLMTKNIDGIIVIPPRSMDKENVKLLKSLQKTGVPLMLLDRAAYGVFCDFVTADHKFGGRLAAEYLLKKGHTRIGCMVGEPNIYTSRKRLEGYKEALAAYKVPFDRECVFYGDFDVETGQAGARELLKKGVTAIVAGNDLMAYGIYQFAREHGLSIPEDLSVIGYENTLFGSLSDVPLTSIDQNVSMMAAKAVDVILNQIEGQGREEQEPAHNYYFTPFVVERESVGDRRQDKG